MKTPSRKTHYIFFFLWSGANLIVGYMIFPLWFCMLLAWFVIGAYIKISQLEKKLSSTEKNVFNYILFLYPPLETFIKWFIDANIIPYSWFWLNRIEHLSFSIVLVFLLFPILKRTMSKLTYIESNLLMIGIIVTIGNLNEFLEYALRVYVLHLTSVQRFSLYYWDTIYDLGINLFGAIIGTILLYFLQRRGNKSEKLR